MSRRKALAQREPNGRIRDRIKPRDLIDGDTAAVYVIAKSDAEVKIGVSKNVGSRSLGLQSSNSSELNIFWATRLDRADAFKLEANIHRNHRKTINHIRGEWYAMSPETAVQVVKRAAKLLQLETQVDIRFGIGEAANG